MANMVGAAVFTSAGLSLNDLGSRELVLLAWAIGGVLALLGALSYAALARRMPQSGGEYHYLSHGVHPLAGFLAGWVSLLVGFTAPIALAAHALHAYLAPWTGGSFSPEVIATAAIAGAGLMHGFRVQGGALLQTLVVALKLALIAGFLGVGLAALPELAPEPAPARFDAPTFAQTLVWVSLSYSGWNAAVYLAAEVRDPQRNVGRAMLLGTVVVVVVYLALNSVFLYSASIEALAGKEAIGAVAAMNLGGPWLRDAVSAVVALALFSSVSAMVMAGPRVYARMAEDGVFPRLFDAGRGVPSAAIALQVGLAVAMVWVSTLQSLLDYCGFTLSLSTAATVAVLFRLRRREGPERVPVFGYPWVPAIYIASTLAIGAFFAMRSFESFAIGVGTILAGVPLYFVLRARSDR